MNRILFVFTVFLLVIPCMSYSQIGIFGSLSLPTAEFGDDDERDDDSGFATTGFGAGIEIVSPFEGTPGLGLVFSAAFIYNGFDPPFDPDDDVDVGPWLNLPILGGLRYEIEVSPTTKLYGTGQIGLNILKPPTVEASGDDCSIKLEPDGFGRSLAFGIGGGVILNNNINIGLRIYRLGNPKVDYESTLVCDSGFDSRDKSTAKQKIAIVLLTVGINLGG